MCRPELVAAAKRRRAVRARRDDDGEIHERLEAIVEAALLRRTLREVRGNQLEAARRLGINRNTLRKRLGQLDIDPAQP